MSAPYLVFAGLFLIGLVVRNVYESLKKAGRIDTKDKLPFAVVFTSMCVTATHAHDVRPNNKQKNRR